jgi:hypothetical protein
MADGSQLAFWKARRLGRIPADTVPTPTATLCFPSSVDEVGGTAVAIIGTGFMSAAPRPDAGLGFVEEVWFGTVPATSFTIDSATQITAISPAPVAPSDVVTVVVNTSGGCAVVVSGVTYGGDGFTGQIGSSDSYLGNLVPGHE